MLRVKEMVVQIACCCHFVPQEQLVPHHNKRERQSCSLPSLHHVFAMAFCVCALPSSGVALLLSGVCCVHHKSTTTGKEEKVVLTLSKPFLGRSWEIMHVPLAAIFVYILWQPTPLEFMHVCTLAAIFAYMLGQLMPQIVLRVPLATVSVYMLGQCASRYIMHVLDLGTTFAHIMGHLMPQETMDICPLIANCLDCNPNLSLAWQPSMFVCDYYEYFSCLPLFSCYVIPAHRIFFYFCIFSTFRHTKLKDVIAKVVFWCP